MGDSIILNSSDLYQITTLSMFLDFYKFSLNFYLPTIEEQNVLCYLILLFHF